MTTQCYDNSSLSTFFGREADYVEYDEQVDLYCWNDLSFAQVMCNAKFRGNADIAGYGVMASFVFLALITILVAITEYFSTPLHPLEAFRDWCKGHYPGPHTIKPSPVYLFCQSMLQLLCDLQILTGVGIVIAGFTGYTQLTFYHQSLVADYWWLTLQSLWAAQVPSDSHLTMKHRTRQGLMALSCLIYAVYQSLTTFKQYNDWDPFASGKCYRSTYLVTYVSNWMWVAGIGIFTLSLTLELLSERASRHMRYGSDRIWYWELFLIREARKRFTGQTLHSICGWFELASICLLLLVVFSLRQFLAIWAFGDPTFLSLLAYIGFFGWNTADVIILKVSNLALLEESQDETWGFGQTLPLVLVGSIFFMASDAIRKLP